MDLFWYEELNDFLEISLYDHDVGGKDDYMGRYILSVSFYAVPETDKKQNRIVRQSLIAIES
jgi:hypothetical protein